MNSVFEIHKEVNRFRFFLVSFHQVETLATHLAYRITPLIWPLTYTTQMLKTNLHFA